MKKNLFHAIIERNCFLYKFIVTQWFGGTTMLPRSSKKVFWKKSAFISVISLHNNITMLLIPKLQNKASIS